MIDFYAFDFVYKRIMMIAMHDKHCKDKEELINTRRKSEIYNYVNNSVFSRFKHK